MKLFQKKPVAPAKRQVETFDDLVQFLDENRGNPWGVGSPTFDAPAAFRAVDILARKIRQLDAEAQG